MKKLSDILEAKVYQFKMDPTKSKGKPNKPAQILQLHPDDYTATEMPATHKTAQDYNRGRYHEVRAYLDKFPKSRGKNRDQVYKHYRDHAIYSTDRSDLEPGKPMSRDELDHHWKTASKIDDIKTLLKRQVRWTKEDEPKGIFGTKKKDTESREGINHLIATARSTRKRNTEKIDM